MRRIGVAALGAGLMVLTMGKVMALDLTLTRTIDAPPERVWSALTQADSIKQWWGPTGFTAPLVETNVSVGGASLVCMTAPGFPVMCNSWTYTEIVPGRKLAFDQGWVDEQGRTIDPRTMGLPSDIPDIVPHVVELLPLPDGRTELRWSEFGYRSEATVQQSLGGLAQVLDKLVASLR
jgi:uncharacterized protein YndB with AHSA1/START domain